MTGDKTTRDIFIYNIHVYIYIYILTYNHISILDRATPIEWLSAMSNVQI